MSFNSEALKKPRPRKRILFGFLQLTRFHNLLIIGLTQYIAAIFLAGYPKVWFHKLFSLDLLLLSSTTVIIAAAGYIINDYYDIKIDYINKPDKVVVGKVLKRREALFTHWLLNVTGVFIGAWLNPWVGLINLFAAFMLWLYSNHLKRLPFVGNFVIAALTGLALIVVAVYYQNNERLITIYAIFAFSISLIREVIKDMEDIKGDAHFGSKTLPIWLGLPKTKIILFGLTGGFIFTLFYLASFLNNPILNAFFLLLILPIIYFIYLLYRADKKRDFHNLSNFCKLLMLAGIVSMMFFN